MHDFNLFGGGWMMFLWWFLIIIMILFVARSLMNFNQNRQPGHDKETPLEILKRRYANGEIDEEEFNKRKKDLMK